MHEDDYEKLSEPLIQVEKIEQSNHRSFVSFAFRVYFVFGLLIAFAGIAYGALEYLEIKLTPELRQAIAIVAAGLFVSTISFICLQYIKLKTRRKIDEQRERFLELMIMRDWSRFEEAARIALHLDESDGRFVPMGKQLYQLRQSEKVSMEEYEVIRDALDLRNRAAHGINLFDKVDYVRTVSKALNAISFRLSNSDEE